MFYSACNENYYERKFVKDKMTKIRNKIQTHKTTIVLTTIGSLCIVLGITKLKLDAERSMLDLLAVTTDEMGLTEQIIDQLSDIHA